MLHDDEVRRLLRLYRTTGDRESLKQVVEANLGLARQAAYQVAKRGGGLEYDDLYQEAVLGLIRGCEGYDPERATRLSTYAIWWIKAFLMEYAMHQGGPVRIGTSNRERVIYRAILTASRLHAGEVDYQVIADTLDVPVEYVCQVHARTRRASVSLDKVHVGDEGRETTLLDTLESDLPSPEQEAIDNLVVARAVSDLSARESHILRRRFLDDVTLDELGAEMGVSRERVRQLEQKAMARMKSTLKLKAA